MPEMAAYREMVNHTHTWTQLGAYEHCVHCGALRLPLYQPDSVTDESVTSTNRRGSDA